MDRETYFKLYNQRKSQLLELRERIIKQAKSLLHESFILQDCYFLSAMNRTTQLIDGVLLLLENRNLLCAGALLRMQLDNCMRTYAPFIAAEPESVFNCIIDGNTSLDKLKDKNGNLMKDSVLKKYLSKYDSRFEKVYKASSGYIHLSSVAFAATFSAGGSHSINMNIGHQVNDIHNKDMIECLDAFIYYTGLQLEIINPVLCVKSEFDKTLD